MSIGQKSDSKPMNLNSRFLQEESAEVKDFLAKKSITDKKNIHKDDDEEKPMSV